jgi:hypothetical protein
MKVLLFALSAGLCCPSLCAQTITFETHGPPGTYSFPAPCGATGDPEGVSQTTWGFAGATVDGNNDCGKPCQGMKYARVGTPNLFIKIPLGGPLPRPLPLLVDAADAASPRFCEVTSKSGLFKNLRRSLVREVKRYLREREADPVWFDDSVLVARKAMKHL